MDVATLKKRVEKWRDLGITRTVIMRHPPENNNDYDAWVIYSYLEKDKQGLKGMETIITPSLLSKKTARDIDELGQKTWEQLNGVK